MHLVEHLERRRLFAASFFTVTDGNLVLTGTTGDDSIRAQRLSSGLLEFTLNEQLDTILPELVTTITINAGAGNDIVTGAPNETGLPLQIGVVINGEDGDDEVSGTLLADALYGGPGDDTVYGSSGNDKLFGDDGADKVLGEDGDDYLSGGAQKDSMFGGLGNDRLNGNGGNDRLFGEAGLDRLYGYDGNDWLEGNSSNDRLEGGAGLDTMLGQKGNDHFFANDGENDQLFGGDGTDDATVNAGDLLSSIEVT
jgi:Ca2+-binding RTX toxin-like protein